MADSNSESERKHKAQTRLLHAGRNPSKQFGFVNPAVYRGSTVIFPTVEALTTANQEFVYGRKGTPTVQNLENAVAELEGGYRSFLTPSGLSAITAALLAFLETGDHLLVTDSVYRPTRRFCDRVLKRLGIETTYYDPVIGSGISALIRDNTKLIFTESPGSQTFEVQDLPAISRSAKERGVLVLMDNTWASPLYFKPFEHGVDVSIQAATKYIVGHADAMLGVITANEQTAEKIRNIHEDLGLCPGPEDAYLGLRGLRTLSVRLERHQTSALEIARWLQQRAEVVQVLYPPLMDDPGNVIWKRDFTGAAGLFSIILKPVPQTALAAMLNNLELFGMGYSWGGFESLIIPFNPKNYRSVTTWNSDHIGLRIHIGLDDVDDLKADLEAGFGRMTSA